jgi:hypothetical protein
MTLRITRFVKSSIVRNVKWVENTTFRTLDVFPSSGEGREVHTLLGHLERTSLSHWRRWWWMFTLSKGSNRLSPSPSLKTERDALSETLFSSYSTLRTVDKAQKPSDSERCNCGWNWRKTADPFRADLHASLDPYPAQLTGNPIYSYICVIEHSQQLSQNKFLRQTNTSDAL